MATKLRSKGGTTERWYKHTARYHGKVTATTEGGHLLIGRGGAWYSDAGEQRFRFTVQRASLELLQDAGIERTVFRSVLPHVQVECADGVFTVTNVRVTRLTTGERVSVGLSPQTGTFRSKSTVRATYWVLPLVNTSTVGVLQSQQLDNHPLRTQPRGFFFLPFDFHGTQAFIQELPSFSKSMARLKAGHLRDAVTSIMVGEFPAGLSVEELTEHRLRHGLVAALSMANGNHVTAPWLELRSSSGELLERHHFRWGRFGYQEGHQVIYDVPNPMTAQLLEALQNTSTYGNPDWAHIISHSIHAGWKSRATIESDCFHACAALDDLCSRYRTTTQSLTKILPSGVATDVRDLIKNAQKAVLSLTTDARVGGDPIAKDAIRAIARRFDNVANTERRFALGLALMLDDPALKFSDAKVMDGYSGFRTVANWLEGVSVCRGGVMHSGLLSKQGIDVGHDAIPIIRHLRDILCRIILRHMGYEGKYVPPNHIDQLALDWVETRGTPAELGYN